MKLVVQELTIAASTEAVYRLLTEPAQFVRWMAEDATLDPRPGGLVRWTHANGDTCRGEFVELVPHRRVVFSYGWERAEVGVPPGSTTVESTSTRPVRAAPGCGWCTAASTARWQARTRADGGTTSIGCVGRPSATTPGRTRSHRCGCPPPPSSGCRGDRRRGPVRGAGRAVAGHRRGDPVEALEFAGG